MPVFTESGQGGGCQLVAGYRFPLRGLRPEEAEALLILGVPGALSDLGLDGALTAAQRQVRVTAGLAGPGGKGAALVHLDMPRWFRSSEPVPCLRSLAQAVRRQRRLVIEYRRADDRPARSREVGPLGLVNKAGTWYLVAVTRSRQVTVFRAGRIGSARVLAEPFERLADFGLAEFWDRWSAEFAASRPQLPVRLRASPRALAVFPEVFGDDVQEALASALPADEQGWQVVTLCFEHELAAAHRLAGFGGGVEVLSPSSVREELLATARQIVGCYGAGLS